MKTLNLKELTDLLNKIHKEILFTQEIIISFHENYLEDVIFNKKK